MENRLQYSEISTTGELPENTNNYTEQDYKAWICAKALCDWGICMAGTRPPTKFGEGMVQVSQLLGVSASPDSLMEYSKQLLN